MVDRPQFEDAESISNRSGSRLQDGMRVLYFRPSVPALKYVLCPTAMNCLQTTRNNTNNMHMGGWVLHLRPHGTMVDATVPGPTLYSMFASGETHCWPALGIAPSEPLLALHFNDSALQRPTKQLGGASTGWAGPGQISGSGENRHYLPRPLRPDQTPPRADKGRREQEE